MHVAAATGRQKSVEVLLANGGNPNVEDRWGGLPLMDAVEGGHDMVTIVLKRNGARVSVEGKKETLVTRKLWEAVSADDIRMLQLLKDAGANLHQVGPTPSSTKCAAAVRGQHSRSRWCPLGT